MVLLSVRDIVVDFAERYGLNAWDWIALAITLTTLIVSSVSLAVARKTLKSQRKTEKNTAPIVTESVQFMLLDNLFQSILRQYYYVIASHFLLEKTNYKTIPSFHFWENNTEYDKYLYESLYYNNEKKFRELKFLVRTLQSFNNRIKHLQNTINEGNIIKIKQDYFHIMNYFESLCSSILLFLKYCLEKDDIQSLQFFEKFIPRNGVLIKKHKKNEEPHFISITSGVYGYFRHDFNYKEAICLFDLIKQSDTFNDIKNLVELYEIEVYLSLDRDIKVNEHNLQNYIIEQITVILMHTFYNNEFIVDYLIDNCLSVPLKKEYGFKNRTDRQSEIDNRHVVPGLYCYLYDREESYFKYADGPDNGNRE